MNLNGVSSNMSFMTIGFFSTATQQIQQTPLQQLQQLQSLMQTAFQGFFQSLSQQFSQIMGSGFAQTPAALPGYVAPPGPEVMQPINPISTGIVGINIGVINIGGVSGGSEIGRTGLVQTGKNPPEFVTPGGYKIRALGKQNAWEIITPEGKRTKIWGDPHVNESDGGRWDFKKDMSFILPDGTKITVNTTKPKDPNAPTVTASITIMNGNQRATISGIEKNQPTTDGIKNDRWLVDARMPDGDYAVLGGDGDDWFLNGKSEIVGGNARTGEIHVRPGKPTGITAAALNAMREPFQIWYGEPNPSQPSPFPQLPTFPRWGGQQFLLQMLNQLLNMVRMLLNNYRPPVMIPLQAPTHR